jgi:uncharacterized protein
MQFIDQASVAGTRRTGDGYLVAEAKAVRAGIQLYTGAEVGREDLDVVRVYRPPEEVFADASLQSASHAPVTLDHPDRDVTAENWKDLAVGEVSTLARKDGEWVQFPLILKDASAIRAVEAGKRELSAGYTCVLDWTPGVTAQGEDYDARQTLIRFNHVALVDRARAGAEARIGDGWVAPISEKSDATPQEEIQMTLKTVTVDGVPIEVSDQAAAVIADLQRRVAGEALEKLVADRAILIVAARTIMKDIRTEGLSDHDIRKVVVASRLGNAAVAGRTPAYIEARFDILAEEAMRDNAADPFRDAVGGGLKAPAGDLRAQADTARNARNQALRDAWQSPAAEA